MRKNFKKKAMIVVLAFSLAFAGATARTVTVRDAQAGSKVYYADYSEKYHVKKSCRTLERSKHIYKVSKTKAKSMGLKACKVCS